MSVPGLTSCLEALVVDSMRGFNGLKRIQEHSIVDFLTRIFRGDGTHIFKPESPIPHPLSQQDPNPDPFQIKSKKPKTLGLTQ